MKIQISDSNFIQHSNSTNLLRTNIFKIHIPSACEQWIHSVFVFGLQSEYEYIRYLYLVKWFWNMFLSMYPVQQVAETPHVHT